VVVDALFGTGLVGPLRPEAARWVDNLNGSGRRVVSVDMPSGVEGATGDVHGEAVVASRTVTMAALKIGLVIGRGAELAGAVEVADIGIEVPAHVGAWKALDEEDVAHWVPRRPRETHKWGVGSLLVVAGSSGMGGAGVLVASTALRCGAGLVVLAVPGPLIPALEGHPDLTEVMTAPFSDISGLISRFSAVAVGPGLRIGQEQRELVEGILEQARVPLVVDADGLNNCALSTLASRSAPTVMTPHRGEWRRLVGAEVAAPLEEVPALARDTGCVVLLKGATTIVASPTGHRFLNLTGRPELATAGTGDVLTGLIASLVAQGLEPPKAAALGAHLHGQAGQGVSRAGEVRDALARRVAASRMSTCQSGKDPR
jgi:NAD(P)H-hydrate epimerase